MPEISFPVEVIEGVPVVTVPEEVDITNAAGLQAALLEAAGPGRAVVVVDMSRTRFCDSAGLNALVTAGRMRGPTAVRCGWSSSARPSSALSRSPAWTASSLFTRAWRTPSRARAGP